MSIEDWFESLVALVVVALLAACFITALGSP